MSTPKAGVRARNALTRGYEPRAPRLAQGHLDGCSTRNWRDCVARTGYQPTFPPTSHNRQPPPETSTAPQWRATPPGRGRTRNEEPTGKWKHPGVPAEARPTRWASRLNPNDETTATPVSRDGCNTAATPQTQREGTPQADTPFGVNDPRKQRPRTPSPEDPKPNPELVYGKQLPAYTRGPWGGTAPTPPTDLITGQQ